MNNLESQRLDDFKKILTYHIVSKINYSFSKNYDLYYSAPKIWAKWRCHQHDYNKINPYELVIKFNNTALDKLQVRAIFGKDENGKWLKHSELVKNDNDIKTYNKGTIVIKDRRFGVKQRYELPYELIKSIFEDDKLLECVLDAGSDYYTDRQRRLIFTQINKQKNYHYKTNVEIATSPSDEELAKLVENIDLEDII